MDQRTPKERKLRKHRRTVLREGPDPIDVHVGERIRLRRILLGVSQVELSKSLGLSFQQVQKYERGANRVSASALYRLSNALDVPVGFFFNDLPDVLAPIPPATQEMILVGRESLEFLQRYRSLPENLRVRIRNLVRSLVREEDDE